MNNAPNFVQRKFSRAAAALRNGDTERAAEICELLINSPAAAESGLIAPIYRMLSRVYQQLGHWDKMTAVVQAGCKIRPHNIDLQLRLADCHVINGDVRAGLELARSLEATATDRKGALLKIAAFYTHCERHEEAYRCRVRALQLKPDDPEGLFTLAQSSEELGELEQAEKLYDRLIYLQPDDYDAWYRRSGLRRQQFEDNHVRELSFTLDQLKQEDPDRIPLCYALAQEWDDIDHYDESFHFLQMGARARSAALNYEVQNDINSMQSMATRFDAKVFTPVAQPDTAECGAPAVFLVGLPCSGVATLHRLLGSLNDVSSSGQFPLLATSVMRLTRNGERQIDFGRNVNGFDWRSMADQYAQGQRALAGGSARWIDAAQDLHLYIGFIRRALPQAKIIHVRRFAMDNAYQMYKTLFKRGALFSYSMQDIADYMIAYGRLMNHWREVLPEIVLEVNYEQLVSGNETVLETLGTFTGLDSDQHWQTIQQDLASGESDLLRPREASTVNRWKSYRRQLAPLLTAFSEKNVGAYL